MEIPKYKPTYTYENRRDSNRQSSQPGYLRSTASAAYKYNRKRLSTNPSLPSPSSLTSSGRDQKRFKPTDSQLQFHSNVNNNKRLSNISIYSNHSSHRSYSSAAAEDMTTSDDSVDDTYLYLAAKYLQYKYLYTKTQRHVQQLKETTQQELETMKKAVEVKQEQELHRLEDKTQLMKHISQLNRVIDKIEHKLQNGTGDLEDEDDEDALAEERGELQAILDDMRDLSIPSISTHEDIKLIMEVRQSIQDFIEQE